MTDNDYDEPNKWHNCPDCGTETMPDTPTGSHDWQRYMLYDHVWSAAGLQQDDGWFCIECLDSRLKDRCGRALTGADLLPCPMNDPDRDDDHPRLRELKLQAAELDPDGDWMLKNRIAKMSGAAK